MGRSIITSAPESSVSARGGSGSETQTASAVDGYSDALMKLIPAEVIGVYLAMQSILFNARLNPNEYKVESLYEFLVVFMFGVFATYFYLRVSLKVTSKLQLGLSVGAFCVWAYSMVPSGMEPPGLNWHNGTYAGLLLIAYTFIAPKISLDVKSQPK